MLAVQLRRWASLQQDLKMHCKVLTCCTVLNINHVQCQTTVPKQLAFYTPSPNIFNFYHSCIFLWNFSPPFHPIFVCVVYYCIRRRPGEGCRPAHCPPAVSELRGHEMERSTGQQQVRAHMPRAFFVRGFITSKRVWIQKRLLIMI